MSDTDLSKRSLLANTLLVGGGVLGVASLANAVTTTGAAIKIVDTFNDLASTSAVVGDIAITRCHSKVNGVITGIGAQEYQAFSGSFSSNGGRISPSYSAGVYWKATSEYWSVADFGAHPSVSPDGNRTAFIRALAAIDVGGILHVPSFNNETYVIDTSGGLDAAILIDKKVTLIIDGQVKSNSAATATNRPYIFKVIGNNVEITGDGSLGGDGTCNAINAGDESSFPGLIYVTGNGFTCTIKTIDTVPKVGILLYGCSDATISVKNWTGGISQYVTDDTSYFGVRSTGGGNHKICFNNFNRSATGGRLITGYFSGGVLGKSTHCTVSNNYADVHEKLCYLFADHANVFNNQINDAIITDCIRVEGSYNKVCNNKGHNVLGGVTVNDGIYNEVIGNTFTNVRQIGVFVGKLLNGNYSGSFTGTKVKGNTLIADGNYTWQNSDGIYVAVEGASSVDLDISGNSCVGFGKYSNGISQGGVRVRAVAPLSISNSKIDDNFVGDSNGPGVIVDRVISSSVSRNKGRSIKGYMLIEQDGAYNDICDNSVLGADTIGISGLSTSSNCSGNKYTTASLNGLLTLGAGSVTVIVHGGIASNARIFLQPANDYAGVRCKVNGTPVTSFSAGNFTVKVPSGVAVGNETFCYHVIQ